MSLIQSNSDREQLLLAGGPEFDLRHGCSCELIGGIMHIRTCRVAPIEPQFDLHTNGGQDAPATDTDVQSHVVFANAAALRPRLSKVVALSFAILVCNATSSSCCGDQLKELAEKAGIKVLADGESSQTAEDQARTSMPLNAMTPQNRQRAQVIIKERSQFRRLPSLQYTIDEPMFRYLLKHPDVAVSTWRVMGISRFEMWQTGENEFEAQAIDGSEGIADILYQDNSQMVFICQGSYHNPLLPRAMEAAALIWFRAVYTPNSDGSHTVSQKADVFVRFPSSGVSAIAKVLTPVLHTLMDRNLFEVSLYGSMMSRAVRDEPDWVIQVAQQMEGVLPQRKNELIDVARIPRGMASNGRVSRSPIPAADRQLIQSPELLFLDPPDENVMPATMGSAKLSEGTSVSTPAATATANKAGSKQVPVRTVSSSGTGNLNLIATPGGSAKPDTSKPARSVSSTNVTSKRSDDGFRLQPVVVPPTGPTATGPVGSVPLGSVK
jgi:hypothetical protein